VYQFRHLLAAAAVLFSYMFVYSLGIDWRDFVMVKFISKCRRMIAYSLTLDGWQLPSPKELAQIKGLNLT
jgi:hypothetical protein